MFSIQVTMAITDNGLWLYRTSYSRVWTSEKYAEHGYSRSGNFGVWAWADMVCRCRRL